MTEFTVEHANDTDLLQIAQISFLTRHETGIHYSVPHLRLDRTQPQREILVVRNETGRVVAYGFLRYDATGCFQPGTAAHPELREPGAVAALNLARYHLAAAHGYRSVKGYILATNENSIAYRTAEGWQNLGPSDDGKYVVMEYHIPSHILAEHGLGVVDEEQYAHLDASFGDQEPVEELPSSG